MKSFMKPLTLVGLLLLGACASAPMVYKDVHQGNMFVSQSNPRMTIQIADDLEAWEQFETSEEIGSITGHGQRTNTHSVVYPFVRVKSGVPDKGFLVFVKDLQGSWYFNRDDPQNDVLINGVTFNRRWGWFQFNHDILKAFEKHGLKVSPNDYAAFVSYSLTPGRSRKVQLVYFETPPTHLGDMRDWKGTRFTSEQLAFKAILCNRSEEAFKLVNYSAF